MEKKQPLIIAHRGASGDAPENTLSAFRLAVKQGADAVELDVHLTKDNHLAVIHNENVKKTTNGEGQIGEMTVSQLKKLDAGSWFHKKYKGEKIPLLEEVFEALPPGFLINIEIKNIPSYYKGIEEKVVDLVNRYNRVEDVIVSSFDHQCLKRIYELNPAIKIGLLYSENLFNPSQYALDSKIQIYSLHPKHTSISVNDIKEANNKNFHVYPWTVNKENRVKELVANGVDGIITDHPGKVRNYIEGNQTVKKPVIHFFKKFSSKK